MVLSVDTVVVNVVEDCKVEVKKWRVAELRTQPATVARKTEARLEHVHVAHTCFSHVSAPTCTLGRCLAAKISASELSRKIVKSALLLVGHLFFFFFTCDEIYCTLSRNLACLLPSTRPPGDDDKMEDRNRRSAKQNWSGKKNI